MAEVLTVTECPLHSGAVDSCVKAIRVRVTFYLVTSGDTNAVLVLS
jgi:hypothetical protein